MRKQWLSTVAALGLLVWFTGTSADDDCSNASPEEARALAHKAADLLEQVGPEKAFPSFMDPHGDFFPRDLYVFVIDFDGLMWVNGAFPQAIGSNALGAQDEKGRHYIEEMLRIAHEQGEGQIEYMWVNPCTREYTDKLTFFKRVGRFVVAVGAYRTVRMRTAAIEVRAFRG